MTLNISNKFILNATEDSDGVSKYNNTYELPVASADTLGGVKVNDETIYIDTDGTINVPIATTDFAGVVKPDGETISVDEDGTIKNISNKPVFVNEYIEPEWRRIDYNLGFQIDMQYWLPDSENDYECTFEIAGEHQSSIYNIVKITAYSDYTANQGFSSSVFQVVNSQQLQDSPSFPKQPYVGYCTIPIGTGRYLYIDNKSDKNEVYISVKLISYRRI